jgi:hypothetical protein
MDPEQIDFENADRGDELKLDEPEQKVEEQEQEAAAPEEETAKKEAATGDAVDTVEEQEEEKPKEHMLPKSRFDEAVRKERAEKAQLQQRLQQLEQKEQQRALAEDAEKSQAKLKEMMKAHSVAISDGELDKASDIMAEAMELQSAIQRSLFERMSASTKEQAKQEVQYDAVIARLEAEYPAINPDSEDFDRSTVRRVQALMTGLLQTENISPSQALQEAVETIIPKTPVVAPAAEQAVDSGLRRKEAAVEKAVETASKQPPNSKDVGKDHDKEGGALDASAVMKMSWEEFVRLPEDKLAEMRGDFIN